MFPGTTLFEGTVPGCARHKAFPLVVLSVRMAPGAFALLYVKSGKHVNNKPTATGRWG